MRQYVILSLKYSSKNEACFWRANDSGYTTNPWGAGIYSEEQIELHPEYYNDGCNTVAVCINNSTLPISGIQINVNEKKSKMYRKQNHGEIKNV